MQGYVQASHLLMSRSFGLVKVKRAEWKLCFDEELAVYRASRIQIPACRRADSWSKEYESATILGLHASLVLGCFYIRAYVCRVCTSLSFGLLFVYKIINILENTFYIIYLINAAYKLKIEKIKKMEAD